MAEDSTRGLRADQTEDHSGWVTTKVAAEALGVDPRTVRKYINQGELNAKVQGKGVEKTYLVSIDSVYAFRDQRGLPRTRRGTGREKSVDAEGFADLVRELTSDLIRSSSDAAELRTRLELTEKAESTIRAERDRLLTELKEERAERRRLQEDLEKARQPWWRRVFSR